MQCCHQQDRHDMFHGMRSDLVHRAFSTSSGKRNWKGRLSLALPCLPCSAAGGSSAIQPLFRWTSPERFELLALDRSDSKQAVLAGNCYKASQRIGPGASSRWMPGITSSASSSPSRSTPGTRPTASYLSSRQGAHPTLRLSPLTCNSAIRKLSGYGHLRSMKPCHGTSCQRCHFVRVRR